MDVFTYVVENQERILDLIQQHVALSLVSVLLAVALGLPLGIACSWNRWLAPLLLNGVSVIYTIPTLALFGLMIPLLGIGTTPAIAAIVLYSLLPIVQNTYTGIATVRGDVHEAAIGMGMSRGQILWRVELPLALSVISAGVRVATVNAVGMVTIASFIGAGGLGDLVFRGISTVSTAVVVAGSLPVLVLAVGADLLLRRVEAAFQFEARSVTETGQ